MFSSASVRPETTPRVPPPSLILRVLEPGPIGSVSEFPRWSWPASITTTGARAASAVGSSTRIAASATTDETKHRQRTTNETATNWDTAAASTRTWKTSWKPKVAGNGSGQCVA